ncbi:MAG: chorismate mutase [Candidatus Cryptobacteroides sp.]
MQDFVKAQGSLEALRAELDVIDRELALLFEKRMHLCGRIGLAKQALGAEVLDSKREAEVKRSRSLHIQDAALLPYWSELLDCLMKISKEYQWTLREDSPFQKK